MIVSAEAFAVGGLINTLVRHDVVLQTIAQHPAEEFVQDWYYGNWSIITWQLRIVLFEDNGQFRVSPMCWRSISKQTYVVEHFQNCTMETSGAVLQHFSDDVCASAAFMPRVLLRFAGRQEDPFSQGQVD